MTRFLPAALAEFELGGVSEETERLYAYHQATKHTYRSVRTNARALDWHNQPNPFRVYDGASQIALPEEPGFAEAGAFATMAALANRGSSGRTGQPGLPDLPHPVAALDANWLSRLLWHCMAVNAWKKIPSTGSRYSLRVNPSSGNLHPTETYLSLRGFNDLEDGLYHYRADRHALELRGSGGSTETLARSLDIPWASRAALIVGLTSIFWREAWKYGERAYRYCCHDMGHATMSILLAARALGLSGGAVAHFSDVRLTETLGLTASDEAPMVFLVFPAGATSAQFPSSALQKLAGTRNELSAEEVRYPLLLGMHRATILPNLPGALPKIIPENASQVDEATALPEPVRDVALGPIVRRRRSALDFDPGSPLMPRDDLHQMMDFATRDWFADWRGNWSEMATANIRGVDFVSLYLYIHRVQGCEPGVYRWDQPSQNLAQLHGGNVQKVAAFLSLEQPLAGNACFAVSMIADIARAARTFGNRAYRYIHFEAGATGQRLYIGAETLGWNATGIGAFYDDDVHRYLGFLEEDDVVGGAKLRQQVIYHFAVGRAVPDPRIEADGSPRIKIDGVENMANQTKSP